MDTSVWIFPQASSIIPSIIALGLSLVVIYLIVLLIMALRIYISKNS